MLLALLLRETVAPCAVRAACGDYVVAPPQMTHSLAINDGTKGTDKGLNTQTPEPTRPSCHGPQCSATRPGQEPLTSAPPTRTQEWACAVSLLQTYPEDQSTSPLPALSTRPVHLAISIYHPPRRSCRIQGVESAGGSSRLSGSVGVRSS
jgi:hypothetical protein